MQPSTFLTPYFETLASGIRSSFNLGENAHGRSLAPIEYETFNSLSNNADAIWILICGFLVFWMQAGFAMLEAGSVRSKNTINILFKNVMDVCLAAAFYFLIGYGFAYGTENAGDKASVFIGDGKYALVDEENSAKHSWFFQFAFAATAATIVSGAVAERTTLHAYFIYSIFLTAFVYPVVSHWIWSSEGWLTAFGATCNDVPENATCTSAHTTIGGGEKVLFGGDYDGACGMIDYAGSGVVHMVGGFAGLVGAIAVGPRKGRFETTPDGGKGADVAIPGHNIGMSCIGTFILWFGWYGFNCGSTLAFDGPIAAKVAVTTTIAPAFACITGVFFTFATTKTWDLGVGLNCILAGLVSITAPCSTIPDYCAIFVGVIGAFVYLGASKLLVKLGIDDPLDAWPVHGACGVWGCIAVGIFAGKDEIAAAYSGCGDVGSEGNGAGYQLAAQIVGVIAVILWTVGLSVPLFFGIKASVGMRVSDAEEEAGLDASEHGGSAYELGIFPSEKSAAKTEAAAEGVAAV